MPETWGLMDSVITGCDNHWFGTKTKKLHKCWKYATYFFQNLADAFFLLCLTVQNPKMQGLLISERIYIRKNQKFFFFGVCVRAHAKI